MTPYLIIFFVGVVLFMLLTVSFFKILNFECRRVFFFKERTKLTLTDIHKLKELCLSKCYFLYENNLRLFQKSGPIGPFTYGSTIRMLFAENRM